MEYFRETFRKWNHFRESLMCLGWDGDSFGGQDQDLGLKQCILGSSQPPFPHHRRATCRTTHRATDREPQAEPHAEPCLWTQRGASLYWAGSEAGTMWRDLQAGEKTISLFLTFASQVQPLSTALHLLLRLSHVSTSSLIITAATTWHGSGLGF